MGKINEILYYFIENYPYNDELSKTRITKMVYLADWYYSIIYKKQLTEIKWYFDHYGPYVSDVFDEADKDPNLTILTTHSAFGNRKEIVDFSKESDVEIDLSKEEENILEKVIEETKYLNWNDFIKFVYSTYPITSQKKYSFLDLPLLAKEYKKDSIEA